MPKTVNRPRAAADAEQMQQGPIDLAEDTGSEQMGDTETPGDPAASEQRSPA